MDINSRTILHIRIDRFPVAVERLRRPELNGRPLIIGLPRGNTSGVVMCSSSEALGFGVEEGTSVRQAEKACPGAVVLRADLAAYGQVVNEILDILAQYSPLVEPDGIGSAWLDISGSQDLFGGASSIARQVAGQAAAIGFVAFAGCASNKLLARVASGRGKPFVRVRRGLEIRALAPLPVNVLAPVNPRIEKRLAELGVTTVGELAAIPERLLSRQFGPVGSILKMQSQGKDAAPVRAAYPPNVIISEHTFDNSPREPLEVEDRLREMMNSAWTIMRRDNVLAGGVTLELELAGRPGQDGAPPLTAAPGPVSCFTFKKPTDSVSHIMQALSRMLMSLMKPGAEVTGLRITLSGLMPAGGFQLSLIGDSERRNRLNRTVGLIRGRFGDGSMFVASSLSPRGRAKVLSRIAA